MLIVDDEPLIRDGLKTLVPWEQYGFRVADTAGDGREAIAKVKRYRPRLVLMDIRMPGMDGLQAIEQIRQFDEKMHVLILSGFSDFEYARQAIRHRVDGYLLKPVEERELKEYLERIAGRLEEEKRSRALEEERRGLQREQLLKRLLEHDGFRAADDELQGLLAALDLEWRHYQVLLVEAAADAAGELPFETLKRKLQELFRESPQGFVFQAGPHLAVLLRDALRSPEELDRTGRLVRDALKEEGAACRLALGDPVQSFADIRHSHQMAQWLLARAFFCRPDPILTRRSAPPYLAEGSGAADGGAPERDEAFVDLVYYALDIGNVATAESALASWLTETAARDPSEHRVKSKLTVHLAAVLNRLAQQHEAAGPFLQKTADKLLGIHRQPSVDDVQRLAGHLLREAAELLSRHTGGTVLRQMIDLMHRNYNQPLKLETLAELFNYNSAYLGKLFKTHTGVPFHTYLDRIRIEKAKELLQSGRKVYEVAEMVGYANVDYFHLKFKKYAGCSPSDYKKRRSPRP